MSRKEKRLEKQSNKTFRKMIIVLLSLLCVVVVLKYAYNYIRNDAIGKVNFVINNSNVTTSLKKDIFIENDVVYVAKEDISNFFDPYIYYDEKYNQIITGSDTQIAAIVVGEKTMTNNGSLVRLSSPIIKKDGTYYIPFSALDDIYHVKTTYIKDTETVIVESLDRKCVVADSSKNNSVKQERTSISRTLDKVEKGENLVIVTNSNKDGWVKVRTSRGKLGYVKEDTVVNQTEIRGDLPETKKQITGNISMIWDYFSEYGSAPQRTTKLQGVNVVSPTFFTLVDEGKGAIYENVGNSGKSYIKWAHDNGYKVWPSLSNNSYMYTTSDIMNDYKYRQDLINNIISLIMKYNLDGINIDFEYMKSEDKKLFNRFLIELSPRLKEIGAVLSVDVTAPDGGENWSMCYDRHTIGKVADYIVFMAYDQNVGKVGTTAGYDWVEVNLQKFVGTQEEVESSKIILALPFYARDWYKNSKGELKNVAYNMKQLKNVIPSSASKNWDDNLQQYAVEYTKNGVKHNVWLEDEKSFEAKLGLVRKYNLAGAAYWQKGQETEEVWNIVTNTLGVN